MRTPSPLVYAPSSPSTRKPTFKRRRLNHAIDSAQSGRALTNNSNVVLTPSQCAKLSCSTCHRALSAATRPGTPGLCMCSRCSAPTCAICARTCTSYTCPSSLPPTPALTRSPSPATHSPVSPRRAALGLSYIAMNCDPAVTAPAPIKRKKPPIDKEDIEVDGEDGPGRDHHDDVRDGESESLVFAGCGRVVCRACCVESVFNDGKLCLDCFALL